MMFDISENIDLENGKIVFTVKVTRLIKDRLSARKLLVQKFAEDIQYTILESLIKITKTNSLELKRYKSKQLKLFTKILKTFIKRNPSTNIKD